MVNLPFMKFVAERLDRLTMYRVVIYGLLVIVIAAFLLAIFGPLSRSPVEMGFSLVIILVTVCLTHTFLIKLTKAPGNIESSVITGLILFLIITPPEGVWSALITAGIAAGAILLKYLVVYRKRHLFNPVALVLVVASLFGYFGSEWWVGSRYLLPVVLVVAFLIVMKVRRWELFLSYVAVSSIVVVLWFWGTPPLETLTRHFFSWPTIFFASIMLTEPLGLPSTKRLQLIFVLIVATLSSVPFHIGPFFGTPELALLIGNIFTFVVDRPSRLLLHFSHRVQVGRDTFEYFFKLPYVIKHVAGQYLEWTLPHTKPDTRGIRRYFTISSAPSEDVVAFAVRHVDKQSSFKTKLEKLEAGEVMYATQRSGDFVLRPNTSHYVWIAGGIGITPFISMMRAASLSRNKLSATLFNCNKTENDIAFKEELSKASSAGVSVINIVNEEPSNLEVYEVGFITEAVLKKHVLNWYDSTYYLSGPPGLVNAYEKLLREIGIPRSRIVTDYFPGLA